MDSESIFGQMAVDTKVCGKMDVNMEKVYTVPETENLLNKDNGLMESAKNGCENY
jgi:hypothetical protein